jgi:hypothetical protein
VRSSDVRRGGEAAASADAGERLSSQAIRSVAPPAPLELGGDPAAAQPLRAGGGGHEPALPGGDGR